MGKGLGEGGLIAEHFRKIIRQSRLDRHAVLRDPRFCDLNRSFHGSAHVDRFHDQLGRVCKVVDLRDDAVEPINFLDDDLVKIFAKRGVIKPLGKKLGKGFNGNERVADFVGHTRGEIGPKRATIE